MLGDSGRGESGTGAGAVGVAGGDAGEDSASTLRAAGLQPLGLAQGDSWYREVLDLRKRAGEYKVCAYYILYVIPIYLNTDRSRYIYRTLNGTNK